MRTPNLGTMQFSVGNPGEVQSLEQLTRYVRDLESRAAAAFRLLADGHIDVTHVAPEKPRDGMLRNADGTNWNPGSGAGLYRYGGGVWNFLG